MTKKKWALGAFAILAASVGVAWHQAPEIARKYVRDHYPGVNPQGKVVIHWSRHALSFYDVAVKRANLQGKFTKVEVSETKAVHIRGGTLEVVLKKGGAPTSKSPAGAAKITAEDLVVNITRNDLKAILTGTRINSKEVCFAKAKVTHPKATLDVETGCVQRDKSFARAKSVVVPANLPFKIPRVARAQTVRIDGVRANLKEKVVQFGSARVGPFMAKVGKATLTDSSVLVDTQEIGVNHPWVAPHPVAFKKVGVSAPLSLLKGKGKLRLRLGAAIVYIDPHNQAIEGGESCGTWFDALPKPLPKVMQGMATNFTGQLQFNVRVKPAPRLKIKNTCRFRCSASPIKALRRRKFAYFVYDKHNKLVKRVTGPGTPDWVSFRSLPEFVPEAFRLMEDPGFLHHRGISPMALQNSLIANLKKGRFVKGGSTITMQLAKNIWLRRHKTIGRKALESCFSKQKILELYLNVVEYGPNLYGIGPAAKHYFDKHPGSLSPDEAYYLASILPAPRKALPPHRGGLARAQRIMKRLANSGHISVALAIEDKDMYDDSGTADWKTSP